MFCEDHDIGYDTTIKKAEGGGFNIKVGTQTYRTLKLLFQAGIIRGRGTVVWRAINIGDLGHKEDESKWVTIKDVWADTSPPYTEDHYLKYAEKAGIDDIPEIMCVDEVKFGGRVDTTDAHFRDTLSSGPENRIHRRQVTKSFGIKITEFRNKKELLQVLIQLIQIHERLVTAGLLHRDISVQNLMMWYGPNGPPTDRQERVRRGFLIDFDYAAFIKDLAKETSSIAHRTGTTPFMAVAIMTTDVTPNASHDLESFFWVLFFIAMEYDGPESIRQKDHKGNPWDIYQTVIGE
ncbi:hypothetical protein DXG03_004299 [Asterophora parasitica]|uniref:Protein kinase domain-containing protein n=1 Tax=Asterophora parasitica TaxID=117018 RepID=A0A9P7FVB0_9AGAR|nr:hypothetical protein DXG03_004299 [Asterophora parasitica]